MDILSRDDFRNGVFKRDNHTCVVPGCGLPAQDAHHIIERRLFENGGYFMANGASVCGKHHLECEATTISVEDIREYAGITKICVPEHLYPDHVYDKWGNHVLPNGTRCKGELFFDESVQKILKIGGVLDLFTDYVKYPRTFHAPWSYCVHSDDKVISRTDQFEGRRVIVTEKMDGENTSLYTNYYHARSLDSKNHPSRNRTKALHAEFAHEIPAGWRLCCENMFMEHSIHYDNLEGYLYGLSVWDEKNKCLSWDETVEWFQLFDLPQPKVLYDGIYDDYLIVGLFNNNKDWDTMEGLVIRIADSFEYLDFKKNVMKVVRENHVQTTKHCLLAHKLVENTIKEN